MIGFPVTVLLLDLKLVLVTRQDHFWDLNSRVYK